MDEKSKVERIESAIEEVTGKRVELREVETPPPDSGVSFIEDVLLFSSSYDNFLIQEEGRLDSLIEEVFSSRGVGDPPTIDHVEDEEDCEKELKNREIDLLIIFGEPTEISLEDFLSGVKEDHKGLPVVWISNEENSSLKRSKEREYLEETFAWNGDGKIILTIIQYIEDKLNYLDQNFEEEARPILLVEDSRQYFSTYISIIYDKVWSYLDEIIDEQLSREKKLERYLKRPFVILVEDVEKAEKVCVDMKREPLCVITDNRLETRDKVIEDAGLEFAKKLKRDNPGLSVLIQSSAPVKNEHIGKEISFVKKSAPDLNQVIEEFVEKNLGPTTLELKQEHPFEQRELRTIEELEEAVEDLDDEGLNRLIEDEDLFDWLRALTEFEIAEKLEYLKRDNPSLAKLREGFRDILEDYRYSSYHTTVTDFSRRSRRPRSRINRIGNGALGGKARGLAFISKLFSKYIAEDIFEDLRIVVPRTIVLTTDVFEKFLDENDLIEPYLFELSDERISSKFTDGSLPPTVIGDLRSFVRETRTPLIVRSSGLLEDSLTRPFAGVYSSVLLPNESWETSLRFREVCDAIKHVYASTFFEGARNYLKSTPKNIGDEKMAVILQEVVGRKHEDYFYPAISGVAKSYNYYPAENCEPEDGIVYLALGLGKEIVEGGSSYFFCPERPRSPMYGTPKDFIEHSQTKFYAIDLESVYRGAGKSEDSSIVELDISKAEEHGVLSNMASTYSHQNDRLYPGLDREGPRVIDFSPIIDYETIPLAKALKLLLDVTEIALGYPVEIEFAVEFDEDDGSAELTVLQIRNMVSEEAFVDVDIESCDEDKLICFSDKVLGRGMIREIKDIVYVKPDFEMRNSQRAVEQIRGMNDKLMNEGRDYMLIGPGRWGTTERWMGIPVEWSAIAGAKLIVETPAGGRTIEPSQGSHFFHDMISSDTCYMVVEDEDRVDWAWLESHPSKEEKEDVKHVRLEEPVEVRIDGKERRGLVIKKVQKGPGTNDEIKNS
ncbi:MAG: PEP/pyruvate-binding domain-containing protein [Candidatus Natronoplasma sp.]